MGNKPLFTNTMIDYKAILWVFLGGGLGSCLRYFISFFYKSNTFPFGTLIANLLGCLLIGLFMGYLNRLSFYREEVILFLMVGFCGGLTTFSSFTLDLFQLSKASSLLLPIVYFCLNITLGYLSLLFGLWLSR